MSISKTSPKYIELVQSMEEARRTSSPKLLDIAKELYELVSSSSNEDIVSYSKCALGDAYALEGEFSQAMYYLSSGVNGIVNTDEFEMCCRCYNELGIILRSQGHFISSEEYFVQCINLAREQRLFRYEAMACSNLASLCEELLDYSDALQYRYRAVEAYGFIEQDENAKLTYLILEYSYIVRLYTYIDNRDACIDTFNELQNMLTDELRSELAFELSVAGLLYYRYIGDAEAEKTANDAALEQYYSCNDYVVFFDECLTLAKFYFNNGDYDLLIDMIAHYENNSPDENLVNHGLFLSQLKIKLYEATGDTENLYKSAYRFYQLSQKKSNDERESFVTTIRLQAELVQQRTRNLLLSAKAETDPLTGIANRAKLTTVIDELFMMAIKENKTLGVEMMDVDFFKNVNDTYGHNKGDELLKKMGRLLKSLESESIFVARYGGDEFILYFYDMTKEEILKVTEAIQDGIEKIRCEMEFDKLSVSQGVINQIPQHPNKAWDFQSAADECLYYVKKHGKASTKLITSFGELNK